jgi:vacuolar-type H+-ATPase subunit E/Vma4
MDTNRIGVDQLIEKVKKEVNDEAMAQRDAIINQANIKAIEIINQAKMQAELIIKDTQNFIKQEKITLHNELELACRDFYLKLNERLKNQLLFPVIKEEVRLTLKEPDFLKSVLKDLILNFASNNTSIDVLISKEAKISLSAYFASSIFDHIDKNLSLKLLDEEGLDGFVIIRKQDHCIWDFRVETIALELTRLLEPNLRKYFSIQKKVTAPALSEAIA